jgi:putative SOS response-associated peptidase YedK
MCGRYRLTAKERYLRDHLGLDVGVQWSPRWNIAPTQMIPPIRQHPKEPTRIFSLMRWGLRQEFSSLITAFASFKIGIVPFGVRTGSIRTSRSGADRSVCLDMQSGVYCIRTQVPVRG